jgi:hypothetical protein
VVDWQKTYGGSANNDWAYSIQQTLDNGYIVSGVSKSFGSVGSEDLWVLRLNPNGSVAWENTYGGGKGTSIYQTLDGGYIVGPESGGALLLKINPDWHPDGPGSIAWQKRVGIGRVYRFSPTSDGGYIITGEMPGPGGNDILVLKVDSKGNIGPDYPGTWQNRYSGNGAEAGWSIKQTSDNGYILVGDTSSFGAGGWDTYIFKLNSDGSVAWQKTYGGASNEQFANSIRETSDGHYIAVTPTWSFGAGSSDLLVLKLNTNGEIPGCSVIADSNFIVYPTSASAVETNIVPVQSNAVVMDTDVEGEEVFPETSVVCETPYMPCFEVNKMRVEDKRCSIRGDRTVTEGSFRFADGADPFDPENDDVTVTIGAEEFTILAGSFVEEDPFDSTHYSFRGRVPGVGRVRIRLNFGECTWRVVTKGMNAAPLYKSDGTTVKLAIGMNVGDDDFIWTKKRRRCSIPDVRLAIYRADPQIDCCDVDACMFDGSHDSDTAGVPPSGWTEKYPRWGGTEEVTRQEAEALGVTIWVDESTFVGPSGKSVHFSDTSVGAGSCISGELFHSFAPASSVVLEYYMRTSNSSYEGVFVALVNDELRKTSDMAAFSNGCCGASPGHIGIINMSTGENWKRPEFLPYSEDTWYFVRLTLDLIANQESIYVEEVSNPSNNATYDVVPNFPFTEVNQIQIVTSCSQGADTYIDNICIRPR